jgi:hypothetical protein
MAAQPLVAGATLPNFVFDRDDYYNYGGKGQPIGVPLPSTRYAGAFVTVDDAPKAKAKAGGKSKVKAKTIKPKVGGKAKRTTTKSKKH